MGLQIQFGHIVQTARRLMRQPLCGLSQQVEVNVENILTALREILGEEPRSVATLDSSNNDVLRVRTHSASYVLKCFERDRHRAYEREVGMRDCLRHFSRIEFPDIVGCTELDGIRYILMEDVAGERLDEIWSKDRTRASKQINTLGRMLGSLHEIPVAQPFFSIYVTSTFVLQ